MVLQFSVRVIDPDITVFDLTGQLTLGNMLTEAEYTIKQHIRQGTRKLVLDLSKLNFMDSSGLGLLMLCASTIEHEGGKMVIAGAADKVKRVLEMTHVDRVLGMYSDLTSACGALAGASAKASS
jgi:anti-sigma B factor antagonist